ASILRSLRAFIVQILVSSTRGFASNGSPPRCKLRLQIRLLASVSPSFYYPSLGVRTMTISTFQETFSAQPVDITSVYFRKNPTNQRLESYPRRMVYGGREYTFVRDGLRYLVQKGQELIRLFDVTNGQTNYRLRVDEADHWTLVNMKAA